MGGSIREVVLKIFLSHKSVDGPTALRIAGRLRNDHGIDSYLDIIDPHLGKAGDDLARHLCREMGKCTHLIAVTSLATKHSQWVPWEIGLATEKEFPLATFADYLSEVPEFLAAWPYLRNLEDVDIYALNAKKYHYRSRLAKTLNEQAENRTAEFNSFHVGLRRSLGQPIMSAL